MGPVGSMSAADLVSRLAATMTTIAGDFAELLSSPRMKKLNQELAEVEAEILRRMQIASPEVADHEAFLADLKKTTIEVGKEKALPKTEVKFRQLRTGALVRMGERIVT